MVVPDKQKRKTAHGGWRSNAGRKRNKVTRRHHTYWASDEEHRYIREYLLKNRANDPPEE